MWNITLYTWISYLSPLVQEPFGSSCSAQKKAKQGILNIPEITYFPANTAEKQAKGIFACFSLIKMCAKEEKSTHCLPNRKGSKLFGKGTLQKELWRKKYKTGLWNSDKSTRAL